MRPPKAPLSNQKQPLPRDPSLVAALQAEFQSHMAWGRYLAAEVVGRRLVAALGALEDYAGEAAAEVDLGTALMLCARPREARRSFARARALFSAHGQPKDLAEAYFDLALSLGSMGRITLAQATLRRSAIHFRLLEDKRGLLKCQVYLAYAGAGLGDFSGAEALLEQVRGEAGQVEGYARVVQHEAEAHVGLSRGRYDLVTASLSSVFTAAKDLERPLVMAKALRRLAVLQIRNEDRWAAQGLQLEALACLEGLPCGELQVSILQQLRETSRYRRPVSLQRLAARQPLRRSS